MRTRLCDVCERPTHGFVGAKLRKLESGWAESWWWRMDVCADCWAAFKAFVAKRSGGGA